MYAQYWNGFEELYDLNRDSYEMSNVASYGYYHKVLDEIRDDAHNLCNPLPPGFHWTH
jgi:hypothetical protein